MFQKVKVKLNERVVIFRDGLPLRALAPGVYRLWGRKCTEQRFCTDFLHFDAQPEVREVVPDSWFSEITLRSRERAVLSKDGVPQEFLRPGTHRYWTLDDSVELAVFSVDEPMPELTDEMLSIIPNKEYVLAEVDEHQRGLEFVQGQFTQVLAPGRYAYWVHSESRVRVQLVDMRREQLAIPGQEVLTRDKVSLRLTLSAEFAVVDPVLASKVIGAVRDSVYLMVQLAARDYLAGKRLDELLEGRNEMSEFMQAQVAKEAASLGVHVERVGIKDIVLPGEMRTLLNRVIEAEKEAAANVILRREETAATRSLANTARVMADHPVLLRLKELEAMKDIAERIETVRVVVGADGIGKLLPGELLADQLS